MSWFIWYSFYTQYLSSKQTLAFFERRGWWSATDDAHFRDEVNSNADAFGGWVMVKSEALTPEAILAALKAGDFYASQGPELSRISLADGFVEVASSPVERITVVGPRALSRTVSGKSMTAARLDMTPFKGGWARLIAFDGSGHRAWSNPFPVPG